jgi:hypothetical protein
MKDDKHTTFQLLATKGDDEVVTARLAASSEYGTHNALPSCIGVLQPHRIHHHNIIFRFRYLYNSLQPRVQVHFSWDSHQWDPVHCYGLGMRTGATHLEM